MLCTSKNVLHRIVVIIATMLFLYTPNKSYATHAAGGEIAYQWVSDSTYRVFFKFYRDCSGAAEPANIPLCYRNTCNGQGGTITLTKITKLPDSTLNGSPVTLGCPGTGTKCTNTTSAVPGYREWWYANTVTLPSRCNFWRFSVAISNRNTSINLVNAASTVFYAEATLNNLVAQGNSSPYFSVKPVPSICINQPYTYNNGGVDPNSDSLSFELVMPQQTNGSCPPTTSNLTFATGSPTYNLTTNPLQTNNSFGINVATGQLTFTPTLTGASTLTVRIKEYRNGVQIGTVMRDIQVQVINCSVTAPIVNTVSSTITGGTYVNGRVEACAGVPLGFCFDLKSTDTAAIIVASDNSASATPGSSVSYVGQRTDSVRGCFSWVPGTLDTGLRIFSVTAKDSTCVSPGVIVAQTFVLPIYIWPITDIIKDTTICYRDSVTLLAVGGSSFTWSVLPGGSPITSLSCTSCKQPVAKPTINTQYQVVNSSTQYCSKNSDTVTINVVNIQNDTLSATGLTPICEGDTLKLFATTALSGYGYRWTGPNGFNSTLQNPLLANAPAANSGNYILTSTKSGCVSLPDTTNVFIKPRPTLPVVANNGPLCTGSTLNLTASSTAGATYAWTGPNSFTSSTQNPSITNVQLLNAGTYTVVSTFDGCNSLPSNTNVVVNLKPVISSYSYTHPTACGATNGTITLNGLSNSTGYTLEYEKNAVVQTPVSVTSSSSGVVVFGGLGAGTYSQITLRTSTCRSDTIAPILLVNPAAPIVNATSNSPVCEGDTLKLFGASDSSGVTWVWSGPSGYTSSVQNPVRLNATTAMSGNYILTATKNSCLSLPDTVSVVVNARPAAPVLSNNGPLCTGSSLNLSATTTAGATYTWSGPNGFSSMLQNPGISNVQLVNAGVYSVFTTSNGCNSTTTPTTTVVINPKPVIGGTTFVNPTTCGGTNGSITLIGLTTNINYTVNYKKNNIWQTAVTANSGSTGTITISPLTAGIYSEINITSLGCTSDNAATVVLNNPVAPSPVASSNTPICEGDTLKLFATSDSVGVTWQWTGPASFSSTSQNPFIAGATPANSGIYSVTATKNNCTSLQDTVQVLVKPRPGTPIASSNSPLCTGNTLLLTASTVPGATYSWFGPLSFVSLIQNPSIANVDTPHTGNYIVTAHINGCLSIPDTVLVTVYHVPHIDSATIIHPNACAATNGSITLWGLKPNTSYSVNHRKNGVAQTVLFITADANGKVVMSNLSAGVYSRITAALNGCTSDTTAPLILSDPLAPVINATNNTPICQGDTVKLFATSDSSGVVWSWTGPLSFSSAQQNPVIVNAIPTNSGNYILTATKNNCTSIPDTTVVLVKPTPATPVANNNSPICTGSTLLLTSDTLVGGNYSWTGPLSFTSVLQNPSIVNADTPNSGNYIVTVTLNGCVSLPDTTLAIIYHVPSIDSYAFSHPTTCLGTDGSITLKGMKPNTTYTINYKKNGAVQPTVSLTSAGNGSVVIGGLGMGLYSGINAMLNNCTSDTIPAVIGLNHPSAPVISVNNNTPICQGDTIKLFAVSDSLGVAWSWTGPGGYTSTLQSPIILNGQPSHSGLYTAVATKNNCPSLPATTTVLVRPTPATPVAGNNGPLCAGSTLLLTASNVTNANYVWTGSLSYTATLQNPSITSIDTPNSGDYIVTAYVNGCPSIPDTTTVVIYHVPSIDSFSYTHPTTCSGNEGSITLKGMKPNTTYTINYTKNGVAQTVLLLTAAANGSILMSGLSAGVYAQITATLNICTSDTIVPITLVDPTPPLITATFTNPTTCLGTEGTITISGLINGSTYAVNYTKGSVSQPTLNLTANSFGRVVITGLSAGIYNNITVTINNCISNSVGPYFLVDPTPPVIALADSADPTTCLGNEGYIVITGLVSGNTYTISYTKNSTPQAILTLTASATGRVTISNLTAGVYANITATINNCISNIVGPVTLTDPTPPTVSATNNSPICEGYNINLFATSVPGVTYSWTGPGSYSSSAQNPVITGAVPANSGNYIVTATLNNCISAPDTTSVIVHPTPTTPVARNNGPICTGNTLLLTTDTVLNATYSWTGPGGFTSNVQNPVRTNAQPSYSGIYSVTVTVNGCVSLAGSTNVTVYALPAPVISNFAVSNPTTCLGSNGSIIISGLIANSPFTITYLKNGVPQPNVSTTSSIIGSVVLAGLTAGVYSDIRVVAANGCSSDPLPDVTLTDPTPPAISLYGKSNPTTCLGSNGSITLSGLTATLIYNIDYSKNNIVQPTIMMVANLSGRIVITGLTAGTYNNIRVTINNCVSNFIGPVTLNDPNPPTVTAGNSTPICEGGVINLYGSSDSSGVTWSWVGPASFTSTVQNPVITGALPSQAGTYYLTATKNNCVSLPASTNVVVYPTPPTPVVTSNSPVCEGSTLNLYASAIIGANYAWTGPNSFTGTGQYQAILGSAPIHSGVYSVVATVNGCSSLPGSLAVYVNVIPMPPQVGALLINYCQDAAASPLSAVGNNLRWYTTPFGGVGSSTAPTPPTNIPGSTTWYVSQTANGCESARVPIKVFINAKPPLPTVVSPVKYCQFEPTAELQASGRNLKWYTTSVGGTMSYTVPIPSSAVAGTYYWYVSQTGTNGCEGNRDTIEVRVLPEVKVNIITDKDTLCAYDSLNVSENTLRTEPSMYYWSFDGGTIAAGDSSGPYTIKWTSDGRKLIKLKVTTDICNGYDSVYIHVKPVPEVHFGLENPLCYGEETIVMPKKVDNCVYEWNWAGATVVGKMKNEGKIIKWNSLGRKIVSLKLTSANGCTSPLFYDTTYIYENPIAKIDWVSKTEICSGDTIKLSAVGFENHLYEWRSNNAYYNAEYNKADAIVTGSGFVKVNVNNIYGCNAADSVFIDADACCDISMPDAFSPNGDGRNDKFRIITPGHHFIKNFIVVNRWGEKVFQTNREEDGWDGYYKGVPQDIGTYHYYIKYICSDGKNIEKKGQVVLVR